MTRDGEVVNLCRDLIRAKSMSGYEEPAAKVLTDFMKKKKFDDVFTDSYGNVIGHLKGNNPGKRLLFDGHMDTVPVVDEAVWTYPPFEAEIADGRLYGRGASDMKGALAAMACAVSTFAGDDREFDGDIYIAGVVHEECFEGVAARNISKLVQPNLVIIGEASEMNIKRGQRGRAEICLETFGKAAHSSNPQKGVNAVYQMMQLVSKLRELPVAEHSFLGKGILELTDIKSSPYPGASVVPDYCRATFDRRLLVHESRESILKPIEDLIQSLHETDPDFQAKVSLTCGEEICYTNKKIAEERFFPGWMMENMEDYINILIKEINKMGFSPRVTKYDFCTNGSHYAGEAGIPTLGIGPSRENLAHTVDEYIEIQQLVDIVKYYQCVIRTYLAT